MLKRFSDLTVGSEFTDDFGATWEKISITDAICITPDSGTYRGEIQTFSRAEQVTIKETT